MFQNISKEYQEETNHNEETVQNEKKSFKETLLDLFSVPKIAFYVIGTMLSMVGFQNESFLLNVSPFAISFLAAMLSNHMPIGIVYVLTLIGTFLKFGPNAWLFYLLTTIVFFVFVLIKRPKRQQGVNEEQKVGVHLFLAVFLVQVVPMLFQNFYVYDLLMSFMLAISSYLFYKIFANSILMIREFGIKKAFSIEEVMGTSLLLAISVCSLENISIFGYHLKNILSILIVLVLGWKNGMLVGATSGITIGITLGIISSNEPVMVASYAISGMLAGIFRKFGKVGVVIGFILGNVLLTYVANGNTVPVIQIQEIFIAFLGLLAVPRTIKIDITDFYGKAKLLPEATEKVLHESEDTILKLNSMSEAIRSMAKGYEEAASTVLEENIQEQEVLSNEAIFFDELKLNLESQENNILFDDIAQNQDGIITDIFEKLLAEEIITEKELVDIFEKHHQYIVGFHEKNEQVEQDVSKMIKAINYSYRISKLNFIWKKKMEESKQNVSSQLEGVSKAISSLAQEMQETEKDPFEEQKKQIMALCKQKEISIDEISIKQTPSKRYVVQVYTGVCDEINGTKCDIKKIARILGKVLNDKFTIQKQNCGLREEKQSCKFTYLSQDKLKLQIGVATCTKEGSKTSGDSHLETKLEDGKYLVALSDGMGTGKEAMKSSKMAMNMLEKLLVAGFEKEVSLKLINSTLIANTEEEMYATLDIQIFDLFAGNMEFIKNGASPTYVKRGTDVQLLKSVTLPTGILNRADLVVYDYDIKPGDILVMCSDGIIDSNKDYINKEVWVKYLLEDIQTTDAQQIANLILSEATDNDYGTPKDDMTVIVCRLS